MKICSKCNLYYENEARYCTQCGARLQLADDLEESLKAQKSSFSGNYNLFFLTLGGSLLLTWLLVVVFHLPVFIIGTVLPLLWFSRKK